MHCHVLHNGALALMVGHLSSRVNAKGAVGFTNESSERRGTSKHNWTGGGGERGYIVCTTFEVEAAAMSGHNDDAGNITSPNEMRIVLIIPGFSHNFHSFIHLF
jgi:hypothetical protein